MKKARRRDILTPLLGVHILSVLFTRVALYDCKDKIIAYE